jgi:5-methylcytosine-specific restriction endonuclease McrA
MLTALGECMELPKPGTPELETLVPREECRVIYEFLYERREDPPTMTEIREYSTDHYGAAHSQTDKRKRELRTNHHLDVRSEYNSAKKEYVHHLYGFLPDAASRSARTSINKRQRAEVFSRYHSRCAMCGKNPTEDAVKLVVDHIVPLEWGGDNEPENLQPLCQDCNEGKKAHYSSFDEYADAISHAMSLGDAHTRIGELLKAMQGEAVPSELIAIVAREENAGDFKKRLRELRYILGWDIKATKKKIGKRTHSYYTCYSWHPYPPEGAKAAVAKYEAARRKKKALAGR